MRTQYTSQSIMANRVLDQVVGHKPNGAKIWSWACALCGSEGKPMDTSMLARCKRLDSTPVCCNVGYNNKHFKGSQDYFTRVRRGALSRGLPFEVDLEFLESLLEKQNFKCALSGVDITPPDTGRGKFNASLDRIDSSLGYTKDNVQWLDIDVNRMKSDFCQDRFVEVCRLVAGVDKTGPGC